MIHVFDNLLSPLKARISLMIRRGAVTLVDDSKPMQLLQVESYANDISDGVERFQPYGFTSNPPGECEVIVASINGNADHEVVVALDDRSHRPSGSQPGEVSVYDDQGNLVKLARGGSVIVNGATSVSVSAATTISIVVGSSSITVSASGITLLGPSGIPVRVV